MTDAPDLISPWVPIADPCDLKHLGKLSEELGEAIAAISRCIIQGVHETEPVTGKLNKEWLEDELADVMAGIILAEKRFHLDTPRMNARIHRKVEGLRRWHNQLETPDARG